MKYVNYRKEFIDYPFDDILIDFNNPLVNSKDHYLQYKSKYLTKTNDNHHKYKKLLVDIEKQTHKTEPNPKKHVFTFHSKERSGEPIEPDTLLMLSTKYSKIISKQLTNHTVTVNAMERQMEKLKNELKTNLDYKQQLEISMDKSKDIQSYLKTLV